jgi:hypothetical protein
MDRKEKGNAKVETTWKEGGLILYKATNTRI